MKKALQGIPLYHKAVIELILAGAIWGVSFTLVKWALQDFSTSTLMFWRFLLAVVLGESLMFLFNREEYSKSHSDLWTAMPAGITLGLTLIFQTHGLNYTTATNSSFITTLYVVMIPIASFYFFKTRLQLVHIGLSLLAFAGMGLLLDIYHQNTALNFGDILTLGSAVAATFQILFVGVGARKMQSAFRFNVFQTLWCWLTVMPFLIYEVSFKAVKIIPDHMSSLSVGSIVGLSIFVSLFAFYLQTKSQKILSTTTASMLCLLEAPYSFIFANVFLNEHLNPIQFLGAGIIMLSSVLSVYVERPQN